MPTGIREVPNDFPAHQRNFLSDLRNAVVRLQSSVTPTRPPTNLKVTPIAAANVIQFTRSDGDAYVVYSSPTADITKATAYQIGSVQQFTEQLGAGGVKRFYWVSAVKAATGTTSALTGPVSATTLAIGAAATVPTPPPATDSPETDASTGGKSPL